VHVSLRDDSFEPWTEEFCDRVLAPLSLLSSRQVQLSIDAPGLAAGSAIVKAAGRALGDSLRQLELKRDNFAKDFWPAVWAHLPGLEQLTLHIQPGKTGRRDITVFCKRATRPLQLRLMERPYTKYSDISKLQALSTPLVTITTSEWVAPIKTRLLLIREHRWHR
jgi:hypothetical protein